MKKIVILAYFLLNISNDFKLSKFTKGHTVAFDGLRATKFRPNVPYIPVITYNVLLKE